MHPFARHLLTLALGALAVAAWAPLAWWPLALLAHGLMFSLIGATARRRGPWLRHLRACGSGSACT